MKTEPDAVSYAPTSPGGPRGSGRTAALVAAAGLGLVLVGVGIAVNSGDDDPPRMEVAAGTNRAVLGAGGDPLAAHNSPTVVASPSEPDTLVVAARVDRPQLSAVVRRSTDNGETWDSTELPLPAGEARAWVPDVAFDSEGTLYAAYLTMSEPANNPTGVWLARSADQGASFGAPVKVAGPLGYQPRVVADGGAVHVSFVQANPAAATISNGFGPPPNPVVVASSRDGGATFGEAVTVSGERERVGAATPFFGLKGELLVLFEDFGSDTVDFEAKSGGVHDGTFSLVLARSDDSGATFEETSVVDRNVVPTSRFSPYTPVFPSVAVAPVGEPPLGDAIYVAWADATNEDWDVFVRRSNDGGRTWGDRVRVAPDAAGSGAHQHLPAVSVAPTGRVDVALLDRSEGEDNVLSGAALATSFDAGVTWRTIVVSDRLFDARVGPDTATPGVADLGSRIGIVSKRESAQLVWTDTRAGNPDTGRQDLYFAPVRIAPET